MIHLNCGHRHYADGTHETYIRLKEEEISEIGKHKSKTRQFILYSPNLL